MAPLAAAAGIVLVVLAPTTPGKVGGAVFLAASLLLFGISGVYHRFTWGPRGEALLRRMDHANIYVFIAATYTPLALLALEPASGTVLLIVIWTAAFVGLVFRLVWLGAPRWLYTALYVLMGWAAVGWLPQIYASGGPAVLLPDHRGRVALHRRRDRVRAEAARPVTPLVRVPRDLPQLHDRGLRRPLHGDLDPHVRRVGPDPYPNGRRRSGS